VIGWLIPFVAGLFIRDLWPYGALFVLAFTLFGTIIALQKTAIWWGRSRSTYLKVNLRGFSIGLAINAVLFLVGHAVTLPFR